MENENVTITLTVAQWTAILNVLSTAPFNLVNQISEAVNALQVQAGPTMEELALTYAANVSVDGVAVD